MTKENPEITEELRAEATNNPNGWVYHVDSKYLPGHHVPPEAIVGAWEVDSKGKLTGLFKRNEKHVPIIRASRKPREYMSRGLDMSDANLWIVEIDPKFDHTFPNVPPEGQIGTWLVGPDGNLTDKFRPNANYKGDIKT